MVGGVGDLRFRAFVITVAGNAGRHGNVRLATMSTTWIAPAFRPIQDKLTIWTGAVASLLTGERTLLPVADKRSNSVNFEDAPIYASTS